MNPQHAIIGDLTGAELPQLTPDPRDLAEEKNMARYSKSKEFQRIREHFEAKTAYYQQFLPGNIPPELVPEEERAKYWAVANILIKEFQEVINLFETAAEVVEKAQDA